MIGGHGRGVVGIAAAEVDDSPERLRESTGISHVTVRDAEGFAPIVSALAGR